MRAIALCLALLVAGCSIHRDMPSRIVQREDGLYEVERYYGGFIGWEEMGGPYETIEEARARVAYWQEYDAKQRANSALKRTVIE